MKCSRKPVYVLVVNCGNLLEIMQHVENVVNELKRLEKKSKKPLYYVPKMGVNLKRVKINIVGNIKLYYLLKKLNQLD